MNKYALSNAAPAGLALMLFLQACDRAPEVAPPEPAEQAETVAAEPAVPTSADHGREPLAVPPAPEPQGTSSQMIDPEPGGTSNIVKQSDIKVNGEASCAFDIQYAGNVEQPVTWRGEPCSVASGRFISLKKLRELGQLSDVPKETLDDLARLSGGKVFYVEGKFSASIYPLNSGGKVYEVSVAD